MAIGRTDITHNEIYQNILRSGGILGTVAGTLLDSTVEVNNLYPYSFLCKIPDLPIIMSLYHDDVSHFCFMREDYDLEDALFWKAFQLHADYPLEMVYNDTYIFGINNSEIWMSYLPTDWAPPAAGTGEGSKIDLPTDRVSRVLEKVVPHNTSTIQILLNNFDWYFNTVGSGALANIKLGAQIEVSLGYVIDDVETTNLNSKYYIKKLGKTRWDNTSMFVITGIDAWGLLDEYKFPCPVLWNEYFDEKSIWDMLVLINQAIGGTLSYVTRSTSITTLYPYIDIKTNESAANVARRLLSFVPDVLIFDGVNGSILYPLTNDNSVYHLEHPNYGN
jgi:hypothetical protein